MTEMIERVVRAIYDAAVKSDKWNYVGTYGGDGTDVVIDGAFDINVFARAAIEAMRGFVVAPYTEEMWGATMEPDPTKVWVAMIDAALDKPPQ